MDMSDAQDGNKGGEQGGLKLPFPVGADRIRETETLDTQLSMKAAATVSVVMSGTGNASENLVNLSTHVPK